MLLGTSVFVAVRAFIPIVMKVFAGASSVLVRMPW